METKVVKALRSELAFSIQNKIRDDFTKKKLSGQTGYSVKIQRSKRGRHWDIIVNPRMYDTARYIWDKTIIYTSANSYARKVDERGSKFKVYNQTDATIKRKLASGKTPRKKYIEPKNHQGFAIKSVLDAMDDILPKYRSFGWKIEVEWEISI